MARTKTPIGGKRPRLSLKRSAPFVTGIKPGGYNIKVRYVVSGKKQRDRLVSFKVKLKDVPKECFDHDEDDDPECLNEEGQEYVMKHIDLAWKRFILSEDDNGFFSVKPE